jgi:hypothetical protein
MRMRRIHSIQLAREAQRIENQKRRKEDERQRQTKINFILRGFRRLGFLRHSDNESLR